MSQVLLHTIQDNVNRNLVHCNYLTRNIVMQPFNVVPVGIIVGLVKVSDKEDWR